MTSFAMRNATFVNSRTGFEFRSGASVSVPFSIEIENNCPCSDLEHAFPYVKNGS